MSDVLFWIWFQDLFGYGTVRSEELLAFYQHPGKIYESNLSDLKSSGIFRKKELDKISSSSMEKAKTIYGECHKLGVHILTPAEEEYPVRLRNIYSCPSVLYVEGDIGCINALPAIGMVGTRHFTEYGRRAADTLSRDLASCGFTVVSGMAAGIDTICHIGALKAGGSTIAVTGTGADYVYPASNAELKKLIIKRGAVISEFPPGTKPFSGNFPIRNRIISGLSLGVIVVEGKRRSGSLITAGHALTQGKDIFAVPGSIFSESSEGPHWLIRQGAIPATCAIDIIEEYLPLYSDRINSNNISTSNDADYLEKTNSTPVSEKGTGKKQAPPTVMKKVGDARKQPEPKATPLYLNSNQRTVYESISSEPATPDALSVRLDIPIKDILSALTQLEIYGLIKIHPGRTFSAL